MTIRISVTFVALLCITTLAFAADPPVSSTQERTTRITVSTREPVGADNQQLAIVGSCYGSELVIRFFPAVQYGESYVIVKMGDAPEQKFGEAAPLVKDLFVGAKAAYQFRLFCNRDTAKTVMLTAVGVSLAEAEPQYLQAKVIFDNTGKILRYGAPRREDPYFIRRGLR